MKKNLLTVLSSFMVLIGYSQLDNGLIAYYPFNGNATDASTNSFDAINVNASLTSDRNGNANSAYSFNGSQFIEIPSSIANTLPLSVSLWFNSYTSTNPETIQRILAFADNSSGRQTLSINYNFNNNSLVDVRSEDIVAGGMTLSSSSTSAISAWHHVVIMINVVQDPSNNPPYYFEAILYVDGALVGASLYNFTQPAQANQGFIGKFDVTNAQALNGAVDDIAFYNRVLTNTEIQQLYQGADPTGTASLVEDKEQVILYPNPATDFLNIKLSTPSAIIVSDINGKQLLISSSKNIHQIQVAELESGVYFIQAENGAVQKFIKQ